ncbi:MAG: YhdH/YhfP family quinone oxidoreductase [Candidatus Poribacteria bacterium]
MPEQDFRALVVREQDGAYHRAVETRTVDSLPPGDALVRVRYSSLNYKDMLSATGNPGVTRAYPHTPGIDAAGVLLECGSGALSVGQEVIVTGYGLGMNTSGGFAETIRLPSEWLVPLPEGLTPADAMSYGTAGFTACLSLLAIEDTGVGPDDGPVLVTGATGGVGSLAVMLLAAAGHDVTAATGRVENADWLRSIGARGVIHRDDALRPSDRPMVRGEWAAVVDTVGGEYLDSAIRSTRPNGVVTCCGMVASLHLNTSVLPFILRGVRLQGIDSAERPHEERVRVWDRLAAVDVGKLLDDVTTECDLDGLDAHIETMQNGEGLGRVRVVIA